MLQQNKFKIQKFIYYIQFSTNLVQIFNHFLIESRYGLLDAKIEFLGLLVRLRLQRHKNIDLFSKKMFILGQSYVVDTI